MGIIMRNFKLLKYMVLSVMMITFVTSCDDYLDVNTDPNNPTIVPPSLILAPAQTYTAAYLHEDRRLSHLGNMLMYNWSEANGFSWYNNEFQYQVTTTFYQGLFDYAYENPLKQYHLLTELEGPENVNYIAIGTIMKAYHYQILVDLYGDVPYGEASGRSQNAAPKYDDAQFIYNDLIVKLNDAIALIKSAGISALVPDETSDVMFAGDMTEWIRFANTLKVRILTRESDVVSATTVLDEMAVITAEGSGFISSDVIVNPGYLKEVNKQNPFWNDFGQGVDGTTTLTYRATAATQYILDLLGPGDLRRDLLFEKPATGHLGVNQIAEPGPEYAYQLVSNIGPGLLKSATQGSNIFTLAESFFNRAELSLKGLNPTEDDATLYKDGIMASHDYLGSVFPVAPAPGNRDEYEASMLANYAVSANKLNSIMSQKRIAVIGLTAEQSWFDYNRTGYPVTPIADEASTADRPVRLFYPASEQSTNKLNVPSQPNAFTEKIFWAN